jgi:hypothetical protein
MRAYLSGLTARAVLLAGLVGLLAPGRGSAQAPAAPAPPAAQPAAVTPTASTTAQRPRLFQRRGQQARQGRFLGRRRGNRTPGGR